MSQQEPYNPLKKKHLAESIVRAILNLTPRKLSDTYDLNGAGVYIIYYEGDSPLYRPVAAKNRNGLYSWPIYVGKAIPKGGRKGGFTDDNSAMHGSALRERLGHHYSSINEVQSLAIEDFSFRALVIDEIFIPLGENMLIGQLRPIWNLVIDGFGNKDPGRRRKDQYRSPWDVIHPGRKFTEKLGENPIKREAYEQSLSTFFETDKIIKPKKPPNVKGTIQGEEEDGEGE